MWTPEPSKSQDVLPGPGVHGAVRDRAGPGPARLGAGWAVWAASSLHQREKERGGQREKERSKEEDKRHKGAVIRDKTQGHMESQLYRTSISFR